MAAVALARTAPTEERHDQHQYLTFMLGREIFALGILSIKEILEYGQPTDVPMMPAPRTTVSTSMALKGAPYSCEHTHWTRSSAQKHDSRTSAHMTRPLRRPPPGHRRSN